MENSAWTCDPMYLPTGVVDNVLDNLDDRSLLNARQVSLNWNKQITSRNALWKRRCERKKQKFQFDFTTAGLDYFPEYLKHHAVHHRMQTKEAFQVTCHVKPLACFSGCRESLAPLDWCCSFWDVFRCNRDLSVTTDYRAVVLTEGSSIVVVDLRTQRVLWCWFLQDVMTFRVIEANQTVCLFTYDGVLRIFSLQEGNCVHQIDSHGLLQDPNIISVYKASGRYLLVEEASSVYLVDIDKERITELDLWSPKLSEEVDRVGFLPDSSLTEGQLAVCVLREKSVVAAVVDTLGQVVHQDHKILNQRYSGSGTRLALCWFEIPFQSPQQDVCFVTRVDRHVEKYCVLCESSSGVVEFKLQWRKPLFDSYKSCFALDFGDRFVKGESYVEEEEKRTMKVFCADTGREVFSLCDVFPAFTRLENFTEITSSTWMTLEKYMLDHTLEEIIRSRNECLADKEDMYGTFVHFSNWQWLNGPSPANTSPDIPILTVIQNGKSFCCLRWRADVWEGTQVQQRRSPTRRHCKRKWAEPPSPPGSGKHACRQLALPTS